MDLREFAKHLSGSLFEAEILNGLREAALSPAQQQDLVERLSRGDAEAATRLFNASLRLLPEILSRYVSKGRDVDQLIGIAIESIADALAACKEAGGVIGGGSFPDFARVCIINSIKSRILKDRQFRNHVMGFPGLSDNATTLFDMKTLSREHIKLILAEFGLSSSLSDVGTELDVGGLVGDETPEPEALKAQRASHLDALMASVPRDTGYDQKAENLSDLTHEFRQRIAAELAPALNAKVQGMAHDTLDQKKELTRWVNDQLEPLGLAVQCPNTGKPAKFRATTGSSSWPDVGRFYFETDKNGKPAKSAYSETLPELALIDATPAVATQGEWQAIVGPTSSRPGRKRS